MADWAFSGFEYSDRNGLARNGVNIPLQPKVRQLLALLLRADGAVVTKDVIAASLWRAEACSDDSIARIVHQLRKVLSPYDDDLLKTVYGSGVRLDCDVKGPPVGRLRIAADEMIRVAREMSAGHSARGLRRGVKALQFAVKAFPDYAPAWQLMADAIAGLVVRGAEAPEVAALQIAEYSGRALALNPDDPGALAAAGWALAVLRHRWEEGRRLLDQAAAATPRSWFVHYYRMWLCVGERDLDAALAEIEAGLALCPLEHILLAMRAFVVLCQGRVDEADRLTSEALCLRSDADSLLSVRIIIASLRGDHQAAIGFAEEAVRSQPQERWTLGYLAYALARAGRRDDALKALRASNNGYSFPFMDPVVHLVLGDTERAEDARSELDTRGVPWRVFAWCEPRYS